MGVDRYQNTSTARLPSHAMTIDPHVMSRQTGAKSMMAPLENWNTILKHFVKKEKWGRVKEKSASF